MLERVSKKLSNEETKSFWQISKTAATKRTDDSEILKKTKESAF